MVSTLYIIAKSTFRKSVPKRLMIYLFFEWKRNKDPQLEVKLLTNGKYIKKAW